MHIIQVRAGKCNEAVSLQIASLVTQKSLFTVTHALFYISWKFVLTNLTLVVPVSQISGPRIVQSRSCRRHASTRSSVGNVLTLYLNTYSAKSWLLVARWWPGNVIQIGRWDLGNVELCRMWDTLTMTVWFIDVWLYILVCLNMPIRKIRIIISLKVKQYDSVHDLEANGFILMTWEKSVGKSIGII